MSPDMSATFSERLQREHAEALPGLPASVVGRDDRVAALRRVLESGLPGLRDDAWRYSNLRQMAQARLTSTAASDHAAQARAMLPDTLAGIARFVFVNGRYAPALSADPALLSGATLVTASTQGAAGGAMRADATTVDERFAWLNEAFAVDVARLAIQGDLDVELLFLSLPSADAGASYPRLELHVASGARLRLIERHLGSAGPASLVNAGVQVVLDRDATLEHLRQQACAPDALFIDSLVADIGAGARYALTQLNLGADSARNSLRVSLAGEGAALDLKGMSVAGGQRVLDTAIQVLHVARRTTSTQTLRGIANDRSGVSFSSRVDVAATAGGADSRQSLKGLLGGAGAEVNLRPQLEISTDEVKASHGATTGALDDTMLFYLLSRGLDREVARRLLEWAFLEDVLAHIPLPALRRQIELATLERLGNAQALEALQ
jgi:Fe-S cluster assembly protein SufD